jgi:YidC/Oxa1 family membrane protein insertase
LSEFQNPKNQPGIDKRVMFIFAFAMLLLVAGQQFLVKPQPQVDQKQQAPKSASAPAPAPAASAPNTAAAVEKFKPAATLKADSENTTVVENDLYRITFTNRGGLVKSWILKKYKDENGHELELVHQQAAAQYGYPLSLWTWDEPLKEKLNTALYVASANGNLTPLKDLSFEYADGDLVVKKSFHFDNS